MAIDATTSDDDRAASRRRYRRLLAAIRHNTDPDSPGMPQRELRTNRRYAGYAPGEIHSATKAALRNNDLVRWRDADGRLRYTAADDHACLRALATRFRERDDHEALCMLIEWLAAREEPPRDLLDAVTRAGGDDAE